jgi:hypothetical protein
MRAGIVQTCARRIAVLEKVATASERQAMSDDERDPADALTEAEFPILFPLLEKHPGLRAELNAIMWSCSSTGIMSAAEFCRNEGAVFLSAALGMTAAQLAKKAKTEIGWKPKGGLN